MSNLESMSYADIQDEIVFIELWVAIVKDDANRYKKRYADLEAEVDRRFAEDKALYGEDDDDREYDCRKAEE